MTRKPSKILAKHFYPLLTALSALLLAASCRSLARVWRVAFVRKYRIVMVNPAEPRAQANEPVCNRQHQIGWMLLFAVLLLTGCQPQVPVYQKTVDEQTARTDNTWNKKMIDSAISMLHSGDLVLRTGTGAISEMLRQMSLTDKTYSHCGIVIIEHGYPFVYHSIGGEDNPDERLRRDSASFFFSPANNTGFGIARYDLSPVQISKLDEVVTSFYRQRTKFDLDFDLKTDDKLYCAEFVYKSVNRTTEDSLYIRPVTIFGHTFVGVDNLFINPHAHIVWQVRYK